MATCHSLTLINEAILIKSADSTPLVHSDDQSLMRECDSAAANVLQVDISDALVKPNLLLSIADWMSNPFLGMQPGYSTMCGFH